VGRIRDYNNLDLAPSKLLTSSSSWQEFLGYSALYSLKHDIYVPIRELISPSAFSEVGPDGRVHDYTEMHNAVASHTDALGSFMEVAFTFLPELRAARETVAAADVGAASFSRVQPIRVRCFSR